MLKIQTYRDFTPRMVVKSYQRFEGYYCQVQLAVALQCRTSLRA